MLKPLVTVDRLREVLHYAPDTGVFTWRVTLGSRAVAGTHPTNRDLDGYGRIKLDQRYYKAHRLAWLYVHGVWPTGEIDHRFGVKDDNRIAELRDVPGRVNTQNQRKAQSRNKSCGVLGATYVRRRAHLPTPWTAQINLAGKNKGLGYFATPEAAGAAYVTAKRAMHEGCTL